MPEPKRQSFFDLWFLPETQEPVHMYYLAADGALPAFASVRDAANTAGMSAWVEAAGLTLERCVIERDRDVALFHDTSADPRLTPNAWAACPKHGATAGPAFLAWRSEWGGHNMPLAASDMIRRRDGWHLAAWLIDRHAAPMRAQLKRHSPAYPVTGAGIAETLAVLVPVDRHLCESAVPTSMIAPIREADTRIGEARSIIGDGGVYDAWRAAVAVTDAASKIVPLLLELSRLGALFALDLAAFGADGIQGNAARLDEIGA